MSAATIKDDVLKGSVTGATLSNRLAGLVKDGKLKKAGEKRGTKYIAA